MRLFLLLTFLSASVGTSHAVDWSDAVKATDRYEVKAGFGNKIEVTEFTPKSDPTMTCLHTLKVGVGGSGIVCFKKAGE
jgi:hypothetical protein